jgi:DNA repair exonuclease SbcCD nuclease subunit
MVRFIHTSDWQIGMKGSGLGESASKVREARISSARKVLKLAKEQKVDFVLLCGDIFEHNMVSQEDVKKVISVFNEYQDIPIYLLPGNHDVLGAGCVYNREIFGRVRHLTILNSPNPLSIGDVTLHPCPVAHKRSKHDFSTSIPDVHKVEGIHIGVAHGSLMGKLAVSMWEGIDLPIDPACVERTGIDYLALGHWHGHSVFEDSQGLPRIAYSGTHEQTDYSENNAGFCLLVAIDAKGHIPQIEPLKTGQLSWAICKFEMKDSSSLDELKKYLDSIREIDMVKLVLNGELPLELKGELGKLLDYQTTINKNMRVDFSSLNTMVPFSSESAFDTGDPTLSHTEMSLRKQLADETDPTKRMVVAGALTYLQAFAKEAEA